MRAKRSVTVTREMLARPMLVRLAGRLRLSPAEIITACVAIWIGDTMTPLPPALGDLLRARPRLLTELLASRQQFQTTPRSGPRPCPRVKKKNPVKQGESTTFSAEGGETAIRNPAETTPETQPKPSRQPDLMFDALATVTRTDFSLAANAKRLGKAKRELLAARPPYTPDEVYDFGRRFLRLCPWAQKDERGVPGVEELVKHIDKVRQQQSQQALPIPPAAPQYMDDKSGNERKAYRRLEVMWKDGLEADGNYPDDWPQGDRWWT